MEEPLLLWVTLKVLPLANSPSKFVLSSPVHFLAISVGSVAIVPVAVENSALPKVKNWSIAGSELCPLATNLEALWSNTI